MHSLYYFRKYRVLNDKWKKLDHTYLTVGSSLTLAVISTASNSFFSTNCNKSHSSFLGPKSLLAGAFKPCFNICSRTIKKCCKGMWSESNWWPNLRLESSTSLITNFNMLTKLHFSIWMGSRSETKERIIHYSSLL